MRKLPAPLSAAALAALLAGCGEQGLNSSVGTLLQYIQGGAPVEAGAFPGVVLLDVGCSGVLIADDTVLYAAHCGTDVTQAWMGDALAVDLDPVSQRVAVRSDGARALSIDFCVAHPEAAIGQPLDIAFCRLTQPVPQVPLPLALAACERERLRKGALTSLVGYGVDPVTGAVGVKHIAQTPLLEAGDLLVAGDSDNGSCAGDSGGPLFVSTSELDSTWPAEWRLAGILSSGNASELCGVGRYVDTARVVAWVEAESSRDLSPCADETGSWRPTPRCRAAALDEHGVSGQPSPYSATCGAAFSEEPLDRSPPRIDALEIVRGSSAHVDVVPAVADDGWGRRAGIARAPFG